MAVECLKEILAHSLAVALAELLNISGLDVVLLHMRGGKLEYPVSPTKVNIFCRAYGQTNKPLSIVAYAQTDRVQM